MIAEKAKSLLDALGLDADKVGGLLSSLAAVPTALLGAYTLTDKLGSGSEKILENAIKEQESVTYSIPQDNTYLLLGNLYVDYGENVYWGNDCYANNGLTILDTCPVKIGNSVFFGPNVGLYTPLHPLRYQDFYFHHQQFDQADQMKQILQVEQLLFHHQKRNFELVFRYHQEYQHHQTE